MSAEDGTEFCLNRAFTDKVVPFVALFPFINSINVSIGKALLLIGVSEDVMPKWVRRSVTSVSVA